MFEEYMHETKRNVRGINSFYRHMVSTKQGTNIWTIAGLQWIIGVPALPLAMVLYPAAILEPVLETGVRKLYRKLDRRTV